MNEPFIVLLVASIIFVFVGILYLFYLGINGIIDYKNKKVKKFLIKRIMTVAESMEVLKTLPPNFKLVIEEVDDFGWRDEIEVTEIKIEPNWDSPAYRDWDRKSPMTSETHRVTFH